MPVDFTSLLLLCYTVLLVLVYCKSRVYSTLRVYKLDYIVNWTSAIGLINHP